MLICSFIGLGLIAKFAWSAWENHLETEESKMRQSWVAANAHQFGVLSPIYTESNLDDMLEKLDRENNRARMARGFSAAA